MTRPRLRVCPVPGCPAITDGGRCRQHQAEQRREHDAARPTAAQRGYDSKWQRNAAKFLAAHPVCVDCDEPSEVPDHDPLSRRELVARGDPHPDAWCHLKPRCKPCHDKRTGSTRR